MGSSQVKDEFIDLYMEINKPYYVAGQYVDGYIYINAKQTRQYVNLVVQLAGEEHVFWTQSRQESGHNNNSRTRTEVYRNTYANYNSIFMICDFRGAINQGHYSFPFSFLLPNTMSGSFNYSDSCYIRYTLRAMMNHPTNQKQSQIYDIPLNIMQPPRIPLGTMITERTTNAKCCGCCKDYGNTTINLKCDKNFAMNGDPIKIEGFIDNSRGNTDIDSGRVTLEERRILISSGGKIRYRYDQSHPIGTIKKVNAGGTEHFGFSSQIPFNIVNYTAIGSCTARYFLIAVYTEMGCCANSPYAEAHIIIHSKTPSIMKQQKIQPPNGWYPQQSEKVVCNNMNPFIYQPLPGIPYKNCVQGVNMMQNQNFGVQPNFGGNQQNQETNRTMNSYQMQGYS